MDLVKGSVGYATFRAGLGLFGAKVKAVHVIPPKYRLIDIEFGEHEPSIPLFLVIQHASFLAPILTEDKTIEWGTLPSNFFPSVAAAKKTNRAYEKAHTEKNTCSLCRIAGL